MTHIHLSHMLCQSLDTDIIFHNLALKNYGPRNQIEVSVHEILKVNISWLCLPRRRHIAAKVLINSCKSKLCSNVVHNRCITFLAFSTIFSASLLFTFWCHPMTCENKMEWRLFDVNYSLVVLILLAFFMLLVDLSREFLEYGCEVGCVILMKDCLLTAIPETSGRNIQE